ncbi:MAG TPA: RICIN domain-containing protein, partial [Paludibacter sp.]|nr:RICIN domain-containing protein [Paludibacter sp.]
LKDKVSKEVQEALDEAGDNRQELEKVLIHYGTNPQDSLKFKAACFLIQNMKGYYSVTEENVNKLEKLYRILGDVSTDERNEKYKRGVDSLKIDFRFNKQPDLQYIRANFLIQHIDQAFKAWEAAPWHRNYSFDAFCEYVLPYRVYDEKLSLWSPLIEKRFKPQLDKIYFEVGVLYEAENAKYGHAIVEEKFSASNYKAVTITAKDKLVFENVCTEPGEKVLLIQHYNGGKNAKVNVIINDVDTVPIVLKYTGGWSKPTFSVVKVPIKVDKTVNKICLESKAEKISIDYIKVVPLLDFQSFRQSAIISGATYKITNKQNGACLTIDNDSTKLGSKIITANFTNRNAQKFIMDYNDYGFFKIITHDKHKVVLDVSNGLIDNGEELTIFSDYNFPNQSWTLVPDKEKGYFRIVSRKSEKCLEINSKLSKNKNQVVQNENTGSDNQLWKFEMLEKAPQKDNLTELKMGTTTEASYRIYHETLDFQIYQLNGSMPAVNAIDLIKTKIGSCHEEAQYLTYISRGLGMPMTYDFIPQWPNRSLSHYWNVLIDEKGKIIRYYYRNKPGAVTIFEDFTKEKVFRSTFTINRKSLAILNDNREDIPKLFENMHFIDVTQEYAKTSDVKVILDPKKAEKRHFAYLSVFDNKDWVPIFWGEIQSNSVVFNKMGRNVAYLPIYYNRTGNTPAGNPFLLSAAGKIKILKPNTKKLQQLVLYRKYPYIFYGSPNDRMIGGRFQGANNSDFINAVDLYMFNSMTDASFCNLKIDEKRAFKYLRYIGADGKNCNINELMFYDENGKEITGSVIGTEGSCNDNGSTKEKVFDKNILTGFDAPLPNGGWVGLK